METLMLLTPEELFEEMKKMKVGQVIDIVQCIDRSPIVNDKIVHGGEGWWGITRIDLSRFSDDGAFVLEYYGGSCWGKIITYRDFPEDVEIAVENLRAVLKEALLTQDEYGGRVAVECKTEYRVIIRDGAECE